MEKYIHLTLNTFLWIYNVNVIIYVESFQQIRRYIFQSYVVDKTLVKVNLIMDN